MRTLTNNTLTVRAYDANVYLQERNVLYVDDPNATVASVYKDSMTDSNLLANYTLDAQHRVVIDMTDYIRMMEIGETNHNLYIRTDGGSIQYVNANFYVTGLINPKNAKIPYSQSIQTMRDYLGDLRQEWYYDMLFILPPNRMIGGVNGYNGAITAELNTVTTEVKEEYPELFFRTRSRFGAYIIRDVFGKKSVDIYFNDRYWEFSKATDPTRPIISGVINTGECGNEYAVIRWVSFTGVERVHIFEIKNHETLTDGSYSLQTADGSYNTVKGREEKAILRLDGLDAYDFWYYSDLITSSRVEMAKLSNAGFVDSYNRVDVVTDRVTIPDGNAGGLKTLEVEIKIRKYDAFSL